MAQHTHGPWHFGNGLDIWSEFQTYICTAYRNMTDGEGEANALLLCAAPDLLEALKDLSRAATSLQQILKEHYQQQGLANAAHAATERALSKAQSAIQKAEEATP